MSEILETIMIVSFGLSWPLNVIKSYRTRTTKGKSLLFLCFILFAKFKVDCIKSFSYIIFTKYKYLTFFSKNISPI